MKKYTAYIPIEVKDRELHSNIYLASKLIPRGFRVVLGKKDEMYRLIDQKPSKGGVFLYKGGGKSPHLFERIKKKVDSIAVLDQELGVALPDIDDALRRRYFSSTLALIDRFYFLGQVFADRAVEVNNLPREKTLVSGWPRVDLWKMEAPWQAQANEIKNNHGSFLLFSSDFYTITKKSVLERAKRARRWSSNKTQAFMDENYNYFNRRYEEYLKFIDFLKDIEKSRKQVDIIVRPHVNEDFSAWKADLAECKKIKVIRQGPISPWVLASEGVFHCGCTTAFESLLLQKKVGCLSPFSQSAGDSITVKISEPLTNINDFFSWAEKDEKASIAESQDILMPYVRFQNHNSSDVIAQDLESYCRTKENELVRVKNSWPRKLFRKLPYSFKKSVTDIMFVVKNFGLRPLSSYEKKMPGGIKENEVRSFFEQIPEENAGDILIKELGRDLLLVEQKDTEEA